jgi:hypothetical protein
MYGKRLIKQGAGLTGLMIIGLTVLALGMPAGGSLMSGDDAWAVIIATEEETSGPIAEGAALHDWLIAHGWQDSHIVFLADHSAADGLATTDNIHDAISDVAGHSGPKSMIFISVLDEIQWGDGQVYFHAADGLVSANQLGTWVNEIVTYGKMGIEVSGRYTAAFIPGLSGNDRAVVTSHASTECYDTNNYRLSVALDSSCADYNGDGYVSLQEAHTYEYSFITNHFPGTQTPQMVSCTGDIILNVS